jgi:hypothetical protein
MQRNPSFAWRVGGFFDRLAACVSARAVFFLPQRTMESILEIKAILVIDRRLNLIASLSALFMCTPRFFRSQPHKKS